MTRIVQFVGFLSGIQLAVVFSANFRTSSTVKT